MEMNTDREWLLMKARQEDGCVVSVGGHLVAGAVQEHYLALFAVNADPIVRIHLDGRVEVDPRYTVDDAARAFWDAVQRLAKKPDPMTILMDKLRPGTTEDPTT